VLVVVRMKEIRFGVVFWGASRVEMLIQCARLIHKEFLALALRQRWHHRHTHVEDHIAQQPNEQERSKYVRPGIRSFVVPHEERPKNLSIRNEANSVASLNERSEHPGGSLRISANERLN
jgi:hypothetical protein